MRPPSFIDEHLVVMDIPDPLWSLWSHPNTFSTEVTERLHAQAQLLLSPLVSLQHTPQATTLPDCRIPTELDMYMVNRISVIEPEQTRNLSEEKFPAQEERRCLARVLRAPMTLLRELWVC